MSRLRRLLIYERVRALDSDHAFRLQLLGGSFIAECPLPQSERFELFMQLSHDAAAFANCPAHNAALLDCKLSLHDCSIHDVFDLVERRRSSGSVIERSGAPDADNATGLGLRFGFGLGLEFGVRTMFGAVIAVLSRQVSTLAFLPRYGHRVVLTAAGSVFDTRGEVTKFVFHLNATHWTFPLLRARPPWVAPFLFLVMKWEVEILRNCRFGGIWLLRKERTMHRVIEAPLMTEAISKKARKQRRDVKLTHDKLETIQQCLRLHMKQDDICAITGINRATIAAVKLVLGYLGRF